MRPVLVFRPGQLGDALVSLPAVRAIRSRHPAAPLALLTDAPAEKGRVSAWEVLGPTGLFSEVVFYDPAMPARRLPALIGRLRSLRAELVYYLAPIPRSRAQRLRDRLFFRAFCGIREIRGGRGHDRWGRREAGAPVRLEPEAGRLLGIAGGGAQEHGAPIGDRERAAVDSFWDASGLTSAPKVAALGPGAGMASKRWPLERFEGLGARLLEAAPALRLLIVGGAADAPDAGRLARALGPRAVVAAGKLGVMESAEALRRCALFVGNDSGAMHLAASAGTRCVALFSGRDHPGLWEPLGEGHRILRRDVSCAGCFLKDCREEGLRCLTGISIEEAFSACLGGLEARA